MASRRQVYRGSDIPLADQLPVLRNLKSKKGNKASLTVSVHMYSAKPRLPRPVRANKRQFSLTSKLQIALTLTQTLSSRIDSSRPTFVQVPLDSEAKKKGRVSKRNHRSRLFFFILSISFPVPFLFFSFSPSPRILDRVVRPEAPPTPCKHAH